MALYSLIVLMCP